MQPPDEQEQEQQQAAHKWETKQEGQDVSVLVKVCMGAWRNAACACLCWDHLGCNNSLAISHVCSRSNTFERDDWSHGS
jgi:hypothetical protein